MSFYEKESEVYEYVKHNAVEYLPIILNAIVDGIKEENKILREEKSKVECGLVVLADKIKLDKLDTQVRSVLLESLENCTFVKMDSFISALKKEEKNENQRS